MSKKQQLSLSAREQELKKLITDAEALNYSPELIARYQEQLTSVQAELSELRSHKPTLIINSHRVSRAIQTNEENNREDFSTSFLISNIPQGEKIFIDCEKCRRLFKRQSMTDKFCPSCAELLQEVIA